MALHVHCRYQVCNSILFYSLYKGPFTNTCKGGPDTKKNIYRKNCPGLPSDCKKISGPPLLPWKLWVNPIEKHVNSIFTRKFVVICFRAPLTKVKYFKGPLFASDPPCKCLWMVPKAWISIIKYFTNCFSKMKCVVFACITAWLSFQDDLVHEKKFGTVPDRIKR